MGNSARGRWPQIAACAVALATLACNTLPEIPPGQETSSQVRTFSYFDLEVQHPPAAGGRVTAAPWIEVRGRTGSAELFESDIVIALDLSNTTLLSSGFDLDGDGTVGEDVRLVRGARDKQGDPEVSSRRWTSDPDDTIALAEIEAARTLVRILEARRNRVGLLTYRGTARPRVPVGPPQNVLDALDKLRLYEDWSGTNMAGALRKSQDMVTHRELRTQPSRERVILIFTDGRPTRPGTKHFASATAQRAAAEIAGSGTRIVLLTFGDLDPRTQVFSREFAEYAQGAWVPVKDPRALLQDLPPVALAPRSLSITNLTLDRPARAIQTDRFGDFSGFVPLVEGENEIEIDSVLGNGRRVVERRRIEFQPSESPSEAERREAVRLLLRLRDRTKALEDEAQPASR